MRRRVGPGTAVLLKMNGHDRLPGRRGLETSECVQIARWLEADGADAVEVSNGHYESGFPMTPGSFDGFYRALAVHGVGQSMNWIRRTSMRYAGGLFDAMSRRFWPASEGFNLDYARSFKEALRIPVICVGGFHTRTAIEAALASGAADAVSCGRAFIADPWLVEHLRTGVAGPRCDYCNLCLARAGTRAGRLLQPGGARAEGEAPGRETRRREAEEECDEQTDPVRRHSRRCWRPTSSTPAPSS